MRFLLLAAAGLLTLGAGGTPSEEAAERLLSSLERIHRETPDPTDFRGAASRLEFDRARILEFVRNLGWEPYSGVLRNASGTLLCGGGNSIDRALLLQAMLEAGGEKTRLMGVEAPEAQAAKRLAGFLRRAVREPAPMEVKELDRRLGLEGASVGPLVAERRKETADLVDELLEAARAESARLEPSLAGRALPPVDAPREHVWVQAWDTARNDWVDLDPSPVEIPRAGARPLEAQDLAARRRTLGFRLVLHRKAGGKAEAVPLLTVSTDLAGAAWKPIELTILSDPPVDAKDLRKLEDRARLEVLRSIKNYRATLRIAGRAYGGAPFDLSGNVHSVDADGRVAAAKALSRGIGGAFGGALGGGREEAPPATFERLDLEVMVKGPGPAEETHRRTLVGPPRPGEPLRPLPLLHHSFLVDGAPLPPGERARREIASLAFQAEPLRKLLRAEQEGSRLKARPEPSAVLLRFADVRRRVLARLSEGAVPFQTRPGIVAETRQIWADEADGRGRYLHGIDILDNPVAFVSAEGAMAPDRARMSGIADTLLECLLLSRSRPGDARRSAWTILERSRLSGAKPEVRERAGRIEVGASEAWWSVDPATGGCVGRVATGGGQALLEYARFAEEHLCALSDLAEIFGGQDAVGPAWARDRASDYDDICDLLKGTTVRDKVRDQIIDLTKGLWSASTDALAGF